MQNMKKVKKQFTLEDELFQIGIAALAAVIMLAVLYLCLLRKILPPIPCFFSSVIGIYCPGCGGTRALIAMLHGHFLKALWYHPLIPYLAFIYCGFMLTQGLSRLGFKRSDSADREFYPEKCFAFGLWNFNGLTKEKVQIKWEVKQENLFLRLKQYGIRITSAIITGA